jgi:hypothetical protein
MENQQEMFRGGTAAWQSEINIEINILYRRENIGRPLDRNRISQTEHFILLSSKYMSHPAIAQNGKSRDIFCHIPTVIPGFPPHIVTPLAAQHNQLIDI